MMTHLSLSNIPIMRRHVSPLKCVQLLFNKACCNSAEVIEPELSRSTAFERKKVETQLISFDISWKHQKTRVFWPDVFQCFQGVSNKISGNTKIAMKNFIIWENASDNWNKNWLHYTEFKKFIYDFKKWK